MRSSQANRSYMTEPRPRVFISSVMDGYENFRDAASDGIRQAGCEPVRAEDFPAATASPRNSCLDGVRSADALVLLLGERYGFVGPSGLAATEEEYDEARKSHTPILVFLQDGEREAKQQKFIIKVQGYVDGHWRKVFRNSAKLTDLVRDAVLAANLGGARLHQDQARTRFGALLSRRPPEISDSVWLQTAWSTLRDEEVIDPLDLDDEAFKRQLLRLAHECVPPLFDYQERKRAIARPDFLRVEQGDFDTYQSSPALAMVEIHTNGMLTTIQNVIGTKDRTDLTDRFLDMYFLEPAVVRARLKEAWSFAAAWWKDRDPYLRYDQLLYSVAVYDIGTRAFAPTPPRANSVTIPPECPDNPLVIFDRPRPTSRVNLNQPETEIERIIKLLGRRFTQWSNRW